MALSPEDKKTIDALVAEYRDGSITPERRALLAQWLAYRDGLFKKTKEGKPFVVCALKLEGCAESIWPSAAEIDHKRPQSAGGPTTEANLQAVCQSCNASKGGA